MSTKILLGSAILIIVVELIGLLGIKSEKKFIQVSTTITIALATIQVFIGIIGLNKTDTTVVSLPDRMTKEEKIQFAKKLYDANEIEKVMELYSDETLQNNPVVNSNLGYLYAKGIYVEKSISIAEGYFYRAIENGNEMAYLQLFAMYLENDFDRAAVFLIENQDISCIKELIDEKKLDMALDHLELAKQLKLVFFIEVDRGSVTSSELMQTNQYKTYELTGTDRYLGKDGDSFKTIYMYKMHEWVLEDEQRLEYCFR